LAVKLDWRLIVVVSVTVVADGFADAPTWVAPPTENISMQPVTITAFIQDGRRSDQVRVD